MKKSKILALSLFAVLMSACSSEEPSANQSNKNWELTKKLDLTTQESDALDGFNTFSNNMISKMNHKIADKNFSCSPISASIYMSMMANAAGGESREQILEMLNYNDLTTLNNVNSKLMHYLPCKDNGAYLAIANCFWIAKHYTVSKEFASTLSTVYNGNLDYVDFGVSSAADKINRWASKNTNGMIPVLVPDWQDLIGAYQYSANAIYFNGKWAHEFNEANTKKDEFFGEAKTSVVDMMTQTTDAPYMKTDKFEMVIKSFRNEQNHIELYLPAENVSLTEMIDVVTSAEMQPEILSDKKEGYEVKLSMPKFADNSRFRLNEVFQTLGVDLSYVDMSAIGLPDGPLSCEQHTAIKFDEHGMEMAAVTSGIMNGATFRKSVTVAFNRPFFYIVRNTKTNMILMAGTVRNID